MARELPFLGRTIVVRQLTVRETAEFFDGVGEMRVTTADLLMNRTLPAAVVCLAGDGLCLLELIHVSPFDEGLRERILEELLHLADEAARPETDRRAAPRKE